MNADRNMTGHAVGRPKGTPKTGGRKKGSKNKRMAIPAAVNEAAAKAALAGMSPLEYMLGVMRDPTQEARRRDDMARAAAPYLHQKLAATEVTNKTPAIDPNKSPQQLREEILRDALAAGLVVLVDDEAPPAGVPNGDGTKH